MEIPMAIRPYNNAMQLTGRPGTHLAVSAPPHISSKGGAQGARPSRPAADRGRWADSGTSRNSVHERDHARTLLNPRGQMPTIKRIQGPYRFFFYSFDCN